jgi:hypothetical protein
MNSVVSVPGATLGDVSRMRCSLVTAGQPGVVDVEGTRPDRCT